MGLRQGGRQGGRHGPACSCRDPQAPPPPLRAAARPWRSPCCRSHAMALALPRTEGPRRRGERCKGSEPPAGWRPACEPGRGGKRRPGLLQRRTARAGPGSLPCAPQLRQQRIPLGSQSAPRPRLKASLRRRSPPQQRKRWPRNSAKAGSHSVPRQKASVACRAEGQQQRGGGVCVRGPAAARGRERSRQLLAWAQAEATAAGPAALAGWRRTTALHMHACPERNRRQAARVRRVSLSVSL